LTAAHLLIGINVKGGTKDTTRDSGRLASSEPKGLNLDPIL